MYRENVASSLTLSDNEIYRCMRNRVKDCHGLVQWTRCESDV